MARNYNANHPTSVLPVSAKIFFCHSLIHSSGHPSFSPGLFLISLVHLFLYYLYYLSVFLFSHTHRPIDASTSTSTFTYNLPYLFLLPSIQLRLFLFSFLIPLVLFFFFSFASLPACSFFSPVIRKRHNQPLPTCFEI